MRLFLLPLSTRRTFIYCDKHIRATSATKLLTAGSSANTQGQSSPARATSAPLSRDSSSRPETSTSVPQEGTTQHYIDKFTNKGAKMWADWERAEGGWKKQMTVYGNAALRRIPYEEWGLKSFPPFKRKRADAIQQEYEGEPVKVLFPPSLIPHGKVQSALVTLAQERQSMHQKRMWYCIIGVPLMLPFALVPIIPNIPGIYLTFRAWSHYRALYGARYLEFLVQNKLYKPTPSQQLDQIYARVKSPIGKGPASTKLTEQDASSPASEEVVLLTKKNGHEIAQAFGVNELGVELERAVEQVEKAVLKQENNTNTPMSGSADKVRKD